MKEFYRQTVKEVLDHVESSEAGLTSDQADHSREKCGWNELTEGKKKSISQIFFERYKDFLVLILIASALISGILGDVESAAVIVIVITINAIYGFYYRTSVLFHFFAIHLPPVEEGEFLLYIMLKTLSLATPPATRS